MVLRNLVVVATVLAGCAGPAAPMRAGGPADASAATSPPARPPEALAAPPPALLPDPEPASTHEGHDMGAMESSSATTPQVKPDPHTGHQMAPGMSMEEGQPSSTKPLPARGSKMAEVYTCPMHPEVVAGSPGKCPKCGMKLVKQKAGTKP